MIKRIVKYLDKFLLIFNLILMVVAVLVYAYDKCLFDLVFRLVISIIVISFIPRKPAFLLIMLAVFTCSISAQVYYRTVNGKNYIIVGEATQWYPDPNEEPNTPDETAYTMYIDGGLAADAIGTYDVNNRDTSGSETAYKSFQSALTAAAAGDIIGVRSYLYQPTAYLHILNKTGTDVNNPIIIQAYGDEEVIIDGTSTTVISDKGLMTITNSDYIYLSDMTIRNYNYHAMYIRTGSDYCQVTGCNISGGYYNGIRITKSNYVTIQNNTIHDNAQKPDTHSGSGVSIEGSSYCTVNGNEIYGNCTGIATGWYDAPNPDPNVIATHNTISNNLCYNNTIYAENSDGINPTTGSRYTTVINNICWGNGDDGIDCSTGQTAGLYGGDTEGYGDAINLWATITGNICFDNGDDTGGGDGNGLKYGVNTGGGHLAAYNICFDNEYNGILAAGSAGYPRNYCYNNTTYNNGYYGAIHQTHGIAVDAPTKTDPNICDVFYNNIACENNEDDFHYYYIGTGVYDSNDNFIADGVIPSGFDDGSLTGDPNFRNPDLAVSTTFTAGWTIAQKHAYITEQVNSKLALESFSTARNAGRIIAGFHNAEAGDGEDYDWYGTKPDMGAIEYEE